MDLKTHPMIAAKTGRELYKILEEKSGIGPVQSAFATALLKYAGVPMQTTFAVMTEMKVSTQEQSEEIARRHAAFLDSASDEDLVATILDRTLLDTRHVDPTVWAGRVDAVLEKALGIPAGTVTQGVLALPDHKATLAEMREGVYEAWKATQPETPTP